jgi:hypothetical protein
VVGESHKKGARKMMSKEEAEDLDQGFEFVLDELLTLITSFDISSNKLFEHTVPPKKRQRTSASRFTEK